MTLTPTLLDTDSSVGTGGCVLDASTAAEDDLLLAQITHDGAVPSTPAGWILRNTQAGSFSHSISTYEKRAESPETSYTFTHGGDSGAVLIGVNSDTGWAVLAVLSSDQTGSASTSFAAPEVNMPDSGEIICTWMQIATGSTITDPVSMTGLQAGDLWRSQASAHEAVSSGLTGTRTATATGNATWITVTVGVVESATPPIPSVPFARYRASSLALGDSDPVPTWADESGNGHTLNDAGTEPTFDADGLNGHPCVVFAGASGEWFQTSVFTAVTQPITRVVIGAHDVLGGGGGVNRMMVSNEVGSGTQRIHRDGFNGTWGIYAGSTVLNGGGEDTEPHLWVGVFNGASSSLLVDNVEVVSGDPGSAGYSRIVVGGRQDNNASGRLIGRIAEVIEYDRELTTDELDDLWAYAQATYGLDLPIPSGPFARYRATGLTPGAIATWPDEGTGGNDLAQATGGSQPVAEAAGFNGHPSVLFDGTDDFMQTAAYGAALSQPTTIVLLGVILSTTDTDTEYIFDGLGGNRQALISDRNVAGDPLRLFAGTVRDTELAAGEYEGRQACFVTIFDDADSDFFANGIDLYDSVLGPGASSLGGFTLGARIDGAATEETAHMRLVEVLIYDRALTTGEVDALQDYFETTYLDVPLNPFARYRAAGLTPGAIATWPDEGYGGNDLVQATGAEQPVAEAAGFNGHDSVLFDGTDDIMATGAYGASLAQPNTIVIMGEWVDVSDSVVIYLFDGGPLSTQRNALFVATNVAGDPYRMFAGSTLTATSSPFGTEGDDTCLVVIFNAGSSELHINDGGNTVSGSPNTQGIGAFTLGGRFADSGGEERANFRVVEVLIYDRVLSAAEITELQDYFDTTYGAASTVAADVEHGIVLGHSVEGTVEEETVTADVAHGIVLGHQIDSSAEVTADAEHGIVLGHAVDASVGGSADVTHGIILGHQVAATVEVPVSADVAHGIVLGHAAVFTVEVTVTTRPIQPMADLRPIQPTFSAG